MDNPSCLRKSILLCLTIPLVLLLPGQGAAFQSHPGPEGLYAHQLAHVFFIFAMGILAYWLQQNRLTVQAGWRLIQAACLLFILWNTVAMAGHYVEELIPRASLAGDPDWTQRIRLSANRWVPVFYVLKLDHLVSVPAMICLFLGIRRLYKDTIAQESRTDG